MSDITPERIAEHLHGRDLFINRAFAGFVDVAADGAMAKICFTPNRHLKHVYGTRHFRAVVVPGTDIPIVLRRPSLADGLAFEGKPYNGDDDVEGWQVDFATADGRPTSRLERATGVLFRGTGHISSAEARRAAAALVAVADAVDAAQAVPGGAL